MTQIEIIQYLIVAMTIFGIMRLIVYLMLRKQKKGNKMKEILTGVILMFVTYSTIQFWLWFIDLEKTKQINLKDFIRKEEKKK